MGFISVPFNDAVSCWGCIESAVDTEMSVEDWWNDTHRRIPTYSAKNVSQYHTVHHKSHTNTGGLKQNK